MMPLLGSFRLLCFEFVIYIIAHVYVERNVQVGKGVRFINLIFEFVVLHCDCLLWYDARTSKIKIDSSPPQRDTHRNNQSPLYYLFH